MTWTPKMGWRVVGLLVPIALALAPLSRAQETTQNAGGVAQSQEQLARTERIGEIERGKAVFVNEMLAKFADGAAAKGYDAYWQKGQRNLLTRSADELLALSERATDFETFDKLVFQGFTVNALGDLTQDLVFFPVAPCRLLDTRTGTGLYAGPKAPNTGVVFSVNDSLAVQGGLAAGCGIPGVDPPALSVVVTAVPTNTGQGNLRAYPSGGTIPTASVVNYQNAVVVASGTITQSCTACLDELTVRNQGVGTTHIVVDVTGYFARPNATALQCERKNAILPVPANSVANTISAGLTASLTCSTGFTLVSSGCYSYTLGVSSGNASEYFSTPTAGYTGGTGYCTATNNTGAATSIQANAYCCRVPGS